LLAWNARLHPDGAVLFEIRPGVCLRNELDGSTNATMR